MSLSVYPGDPRKESYIADGNLPEFFLLVVYCLSCLLVFSTLVPLLLFLLSFLTAWQWADLFQNSSCPKPNIFFGKKVEVTFPCEIVTPVAIVPLSLLAISLNTWYPLALS